MRKGGPDGGDGGLGGSVLIRADEGLKTLMDFQRRRHHRAPRGEHGKGDDRHGASGADLVLRVPVGTVVKEESGTIIADLVADGDEAVLAAGGLGGRGNAKFSTSTKRAPAFAENGEPGAERDVFLELKLLADVGLVGYPNAGKSTLISRVSASKPKIASYPFTTLEPNLGVVNLAADDTFVIADIPGLIEGAHQGKGLGDKFLRHLERTAVLLHLIDMSGLERDDPVADYERILLELKGYGAGLSERPSIVVGTKIDLPEAQAHVDRAKEKFAKLGVDFIPVSAVTGEGIQALVFQTSVLVKEESEKKSAIDSENVKVYRYNEIDKITVERLSQRSWEVKGRAILRQVRMTDFTNDEAIDFLRRKLTKAGVDEELKKAGAGQGDEVVIGEMAFEFEAE